MLRNGDREHPVFPSRVHALAVGSVRQYKAPMEMPVTALGAPVLNILVPTLAGLLGSLTGERQYAILQRQVDFAGFDTRQVNVQFEAIAVLLDIHRRYPGSGGGTAVIFIQVAE